MRSSGSSLLPLVLLPALLGAQPAPPPGGPVAPGGPPAPWWSPWGDQGLYGIPEFAAPGGAPGSPYPPAAGPGQPYDPAGTPPPGGLPPIWIDGPVPSFLPYLPPPDVPVGPPPAPAADPAAAPAATGGAYTVVPGDSLSKIAGRLCGASGRWREIYDANRDQIRDPNLIYPGQTFAVPCAAGPGVGAAAGVAPPVGAPPPGALAPRGTPGAPPSGAFAPLGAPGTPAPGSAVPRADGTPPPPGGIDPRIIGPGRDFLTHLPLKEWDFLSKWGDCRDGCRRKHEGNDLGAPHGTPIHAMGPGRVERAEFIGGYGWAVYIRHPNGYVTRYAHLQSKPPVSPGQEVRGGEVIGAVGSSGNASASLPHLHFEIHGPGGAQDPEKFCNHR